VFHFSVSFLFGAVKQRGGGENIEWGREGGHSVAGTYARYTQSLAQASGGLRLPVRNSNQMGWEIVILRRLRNVRGLSLAAGEIKRVPVSFLRNIRAQSFVQCNL